MPAQKVTHYQMSVNPHTGLMFANVRFEDDPDQPIQIGINNIQMWTALAVLFREGPIYFDNGFFRNALEPITDTQT